MDSKELEKIFRVTLQDEFKKAGWEDFQQVKGTLIIMAHNYQSAVKFGRWFGKGLVYGSLLVGMLAGLFEIFKKK